MAGSPHGSAWTTPRVRAKLQASQEATSILAQRYGLSRNAVAKWRTRRKPLWGFAQTTTDYAPMGPSSPHGGVPTRAEEVMFARTAIGFVHIAAADPADFRDISHLRLAGSKLSMFLAIDRVSKFWDVELRDVGKMNGAEFLRRVVEAFSYALHTVLTDNGMAFADLPKNRNGPTRRYLGAHIVDRVCAENGIEHRLTKPYPPWTNAGPSG